MMAVSSAYRWLSVLAVRLSAWVSGSGQPTLELGVLPEQALDAFEHRLALLRLIDRST